MRLAIILAAVLMNSALAAPDVACVKAANERKRKCDAVCNERWWGDCVKACSGQGVCVMGCQQREKQCNTDCTNTHNSEVARCPQRKSSHRRNLH